jgi:predicted phosphohydrolase
LTRFVCLSDTHSKHSKIEVPDGDVLIHAGDFCHFGTPEESRDFLNWYSSLPHPHKLLIRGNHDDKEIQIPSEIVNLSKGSVLIGHKIGERLESKAEIFGGVVLVAIGAKILAEHLGFI